MPDVTKNAGLTITESVPVVAVAVGQRVALRIGLTTAAIRRGRDLAREIKPELAEQTNLAIEIEDARGNLRCKATFEAVHSQTQLMKETLSRIAQGEHS